MTGDAKAERTSGHDRSVPETVAKRVWVAPRMILDSIAKSQGLNPPLAEPNGLGGTEPLS